MVRGPDGTGARDDTEALAEVLERRFRRMRADGNATTDDAEEGRDTGARRARFAYPPNLVVVDGGPPQVAAVQAVLDALGVDDVALIGLAKRLEEVWLPGDDFPLVLPRQSEGLYLLQRVRDEAHRFAITHHRERRTKAMTASALDEVPGLGPVRRAALLERFGSVRALRAADVDEIAAVPGVGPRTAALVVAALRGGADGAANGGSANGGSANGGRAPAARLEEASTAPVSVGEAAT